MLSQSVFARLDDGRVVHKYRITNAFGEFVEILDYGACLYSVNVLDKNGRLGDVVLGVPDGDHLTQGRFSGVTVGRCANRIAHGRFRLNGQTIQLECNQGGHHLHGASGGYGGQLFTRIPSAEADQVCLSLLDLGGGGYNNTVQATVCFSFGNDHCLRIHYHMVGQSDTLLCPTNHAYFNLDGASDIRGHELCIQAEQYAVKGADGIPEGETAGVAGTPLDFRRMRLLGEALQENVFFSRLPPELDDTFLLRHPPGTCALAAQLQSRNSGRTMRVYTDMPALIAFTMFVRNPVPGKHGILYQGYPAIALETQYVPNAVNCTGFAVPLFRAGQPLISDTVYAFGTI